MIQIFVKYLIGLKLSILTIFQGFFFEIKYMSITRKNVNKKTGCMDTKCKLWLEKGEKTENKFKVMLEKGIKETEKKLSKTCNKTGASTKTCEKLKNGNVFRKELLKKIKKRKRTEKGDKIELDKCARYFCNEGCEGTVFEDGPPDKLSEKTRKFLKTKKLIKLIKQSRKNIFGKKNSVLQDGFYEGMNLKRMNQLKKEGAISGCTLV